MDDETNREIWVVAETDEQGLSPGTLEALGEGRALAAGSQARLGVLLAGNDTGRYLTALSCRGVDVVYCLENPRLECQRLPESVPVLAACIRAYRPRLVLFSASAFGGECAARLAARLGKALVSGCVQVKEEGDRFRCTRPIYDGKAQADMYHKGAPPYLVTLLPEAIGLEAALPRRDPEIVLTRPDLEERPTSMRWLGVETCDPVSLDVREAERIVAGGRGLCDVAGWQLLERLAAALEAAPAGSRAALDLGLLGRESLVGQTGKRVNPRLYLAAGISGSPYHLRAVQAETLVAINPDRSAAVFKDCQLGLVGDFFEIAPRFLDMINTRFGESGPDGG